jgi:alkylhydroperoxidase family enzyme
MCSRGARIGWWRSARRGARGIGVPVRRLGAPVEDREPSRERPSVAKKEGFFTASIPSAPAGGELAVSLFGNQPAPNILRSLSLVPDEARRLNALLNQEYFSMQTIFDFTCSSHNSITRPQLELIAAKVSELNQCFYWTTWHTHVLRESGEATKIDIKLAGVFNSDEQSGVEYGSELIAFASAVVGSDLGALNSVRQALRAAMGPDAVVSASIIAGVFSLVDRAANGIGIFVEPMVLEPSADFREQFGINQFPSAANTLG